MSVLTIRAHRRYAVRLGVEITRASDKPVEGLLIELSCEGARISNLGPDTFASGDAVVLHLEGGTRLGATIRWAHDGLAGIRLDRALHAAELAEMLARHRDHLAVTMTPRYGT